MLNYVMSCFTSRLGVAVALVVASFIIGAASFFMFGILDIIASRDAVVLVALASSFLVCCLFLLGGAISVWRHQVAQHRNLQQQQKQHKQQQQQRGRRNSPEPGRPPIPRAASASSSSERSRSGSHPRTLPPPPPRGGQAQSIAAMASMLINHGPMREAANDLQWLHERVTGGSEQHAAFARGLSQTSVELLAELDQTISSNPPSPVASKTKKSAQQQQLVSPPPVSAPSLLLGDFDVGLCWASSVNNLRPLAMGLLTAWATGVTLSYGPVYGLRFTIECLVVLNMPNFIVQVWLKTTYSATRCIEDLLWLRRTSYASVLFLLQLPFASLLLWAAVDSLTSSSGSSHAGFILASVCFAALALLSRSLLLIRYDYLTCSVRWSARRIFTSGAASPPSPQSPSASPDAVDKFVPVPLHRALALELAHEAGQVHVTRSGDFIANLRCLKMIRAARGDVATQHAHSGGYLLRRDEIQLRAAPSAFTVAARLLPSLLLFRTRGASDLARSPAFSMARAVMRIFAGVLLGILCALVVTLVAQETFSLFRPLPSTISCNEPGNKPLSECRDITVDHIVIRIRIRLRGATSAPLPSQSSNATSEVHAAVQHSYVMCHIAPLMPEVPDVSLFELALLALPPYLASSADATTLVHFVNRALGLDAAASAWQVDVPLRARRAGEQWRAFMALDRHIGSNESQVARRHLRLLSVRGTDATDVLDFLEDVRLFAPAAIYSAMTHVIPLLSLLPTKLVQDAIWLSGVGHAGGIGHADSRFYYAEVLRDFLRADEARFPDAIHASTSHSLGGALLKIARSPRQRTITFSSPGTLYSAKLWNVEPGPGINFLLDHDIVPLIGGSSSSSIRGDCLLPDKERCHALEATIQSLWHSCPSMRARYTEIEDVIVW